MLTILKPNGETEQRRSPIPALGALFRKYFEVNTGRKCAMTWGRMGATFKRKFEQADMETGELLIEYPDEDSFEIEVRGFFVNDYAKRAGFPFDLFMNGYGNYSGLVPNKREKPRATLVKWESCPDCGRDVLPGVVCECKK